MKVVVKDANIISSLLDSKLMNLALGLDIQVWTTDFVISEMEHPEQLTKIEKLTKKKKIQIYEFDADEVTKITEMATECSFSITDCSVILLSQKKNADLISSDRHLRNRASAEGLKVRGLLWILDKLVAEGLLDPQKAANKLKFIAEKSMRLPQDEVEND
jgi:predicted nucleic acid-binding protein